ncbi:MAG: hypothetical protein WAL31_09520, partial [Gaiellaceae bacterium]
RLKPRERVIPEARADATITPTMNAAARRNLAIEPRRTGLLSAPVPQSMPGLRSIGSGPVRPLMEPDPDAPTFDRSRDGVAFLWLVVLILAFVLSIGLLGQS